MASFRCSKPLWSMLLAVLMSLVALPATAAEQDVEVEFLTGASAREALTADAGEPFFSEVTPVSVTALSGGAVDAQREDYREAFQGWYEQQVREFTAQEKRAVRALVERLQPAIAEEFPALARTPWRFVKVTEQTTGGLPHTLGDVIVVPPVWAEQLVIAHQQEHDHALIGASFLLVHELTHVYERAHAESFEPLYEQQWGFHKADRIEADPWVQAHELKNPDAVDTRWVWPIEQDDQTRWIWPLLTVADADAPDMPDGLRLVAVELEQQEPGVFAVRSDEGQPIYQPLGQVEPYMQQFPDVNSVYHPEEILADMVAFFVVDRFIQSSNIEGPVPDYHQQIAEQHEATRQWLRSALGDRP